MSPRVPEINQHAIAHVLRDKAVEAGDDLGDRAVICADHLPQIRSAMIEARKAMQASRILKIRKDFRT